MAQSVLEASLRPGAGPAPSVPKPLQLLLPVPCPEAPGLGAAGTVPFLSGPRQGSFLQTRSSQPVSR